MIRQTVAQLTPEQQASVLDAVSKAEAGTSGEIVPLLVAQSEDYHETAIQTAVIVAAVLGLLLAIATQDLSVWFFFLVTFLLYFPALAAVHRLPRLKRACTPEKKIREVVRRRAIQAFYEHGLHRTRDENGILIFISQLERKVWILGDRGINAVIPADRWNDLASVLSSGIRKGQLTETLISVIADIGAILEQHFPHRQDDINELPDLIEDK